MDTSLQKGKRASIYDVAKDVGTSPATVSRVLSNNGYPVNDELRQKILEAAKKLDYLPNKLGRMLKSSQTNMIGIVIPTIANPFYSQVVLGIEAEARRVGYSVLLCNTFRDAAEEDKYIKSLFERQVMGIALSSVAENHDLIKALQQKGLRVVLIDQEARDIDCGRISFNYLKGGIIATEYLIRNGHRKMAYLTSPLVRHSRIEQLEGFKIAHFMHGLEYDPANVIVDDVEEENTESIYESECGKRLVGRMLSMNDRPTAILASNDMIAIGAMQQLAAQGVSVPEEISVIGFDNIFMASVVNPPLTTIDQPSVETGRFVCRMLIDMLEGNSGSCVAVTLEPAVVERKSVKQLM